MPSSGERGIPGQPRARRRRQEDEPSRVGGTGTVSSRSRTTSSALTCCTQSSGCSVSLCASAGTAIAFTSSGVTKSRPWSAADAARELEQRQRAARRGAHLDLRSVTRGRHDVDHVRGDRLRDVHLLDRLLQLEQRLPVADHPQLDRVGPALGALEQKPALVVPGRIPDRDTHQESIELSLGQGIRALVLDRVLGREHDERPLQRMGVPVGRHLLLLHRLEQRCLRLRRGAIDLVGEEEVREHGARLEAEDGIALVVDRRARDVRGHQVGRELDAREPHRADTRDRPRDERLGKPRKVLDQNVSVGEQAHQDELDLRALADHGALDLVEDVGRTRPPRSQAAIAT